MRIKWYFTDLPFLDSPSIINSRDWDETPWVTYPVGELPGQSRGYNGANIMPGLTGDHTCGSIDQFAEGAPWPHVGPPVEYDRDWIPTCCGRKPVGQITTGNWPRASVAFRYPTEPRITTGSYPRASVALVYPFMQRITTGARPAASVAWFARPVPSITTGARPAASVALTYEASTALTTGARPGAAYELLIPAPVEGLATGARPAAAVALAFEPSVTITTGARPAAAVTVSFEYSPSIKTGARLGSPFDLTITAPVAGIKSGAKISATVNYTPPPTPGTACASAAQLQTGITYNFTTSGTPGTVQWVFWITSVGIHSLASSRLTGPSYAVEAFNGPSCAALSPPLPVTTNPQNVGTDLTGHVWYRITNNVLGATSWTVKLT